MAYCANHPQAAAAVYCRTCGKPLCESCKREVRGVIYCEECLAARMAGDPAVASASVPPPTAAAPASWGANPVLAAILGFLFPGVGAMYNAQFAKGLLHIAIFAILVKLTEDVAGIFGLGIAGWIFYMAFDAYHTAKARQMNMPVPDYLGMNRMFGGRDARYASGPAVPPAFSGDPLAPGVPSHEKEGGIPMGAYWLIGIGVFFLLVNMGIFDWRWTRYLWTFVLIGFGLYLGYQRWTGPRKGRPFCPCTRCRMQDMMGPAMMVTVGVLGLLHATYALRFHNSWPVFLIVIGAVRLAQVSASTEGHVEFVPPLPPQPGPAAGTTQTASTETPSSAGGM